MSISPHIGTFDRQARRHFQGAKIFECTDMIQFYYIFRNPKTIRLIILTQLCGFYLKAQRALIIIRALTWFNSFLFSKIEKQVHNSALFFNCISAFLYKRTDMITFFLKCQKPVQVLFQSPSADIF